MSKAITMVEPDFSFTSLPSSSTIARKKETAHAPKGKLSVKLISARSLNSPNPYSRPYVVVSFDQNEFISREPIHEEGEEVTGVAGLKKDSGGIVNSPIGGIGGSGGKSVLPDLTGGQGGSGSNNTSGTSTPTPSPSTPTTSNATLLSPLNGKMSSGLGRSLETYRNGIIEAAASASATLLPTPSTSMHDDSPADDNEVDMLSNSVRQIELSNSQNQSAYNPTWKHEVFL